MLAEALTRREILALEPPEDLSPSEWCRRNVRLPGGAKDQSVPFDPDRTPYLREILDATADPTVEVITFVASTQIGKTVLELCVMARCAAQRPGNTLWVMPTEDAAKAIVEERVKPMINASPALRRLKTDRAADWGKNGINLQASSIHIGYANSPTSLASRPLPYIMGDELAKWPLFSKDEGDPVKLATERTRWFPYRTIVLVSTPKVEHDIIWREWLAGDQRLFWVPCPNCGEYQTLEFDRERVRLRPGHEDERDRAKIIQGNLAVYHCEHCDAPIEDDQKPEMLARGVWCPDQCDVVDGLIAGELPPGMFRSYRINCLYSPMLTWSRILAEFFDSKDDISKLMNFTQSWLAQPWRERETSVTEEMLIELEEEYDESTVPDGVQVLVAGADVQHGTCYYVVRGWGANDDSWLIEAGMTESDASETDLEKLGRLMADAEWPKADGTVCKVQICCVDSGDGARTHEIYDLSRAYPQVIRACKGRDTLGTSPVMTNQVEKHDGRRQFPGAVLLSSVNTDYYKTKLAGKISNPTNRGAFRIPSDVGVGYRKSLVSEHKVITRDTKGRPKSSWMVRPGYGNQNHWWDCEVYAQASAFLRTLNRLPENPIDHEEMRRRNRQQSKAARNSPSRRRGKRGGWMSGV